MSEIDDEINLTPHDITKYSWLRELLGDDRIAIGVIIERIESLLIEARNAGKQEVIDTLEKKGEYVLYDDGNGSRLVAELNKRKVSDE